MMHHPARTPWRLLFIAILLLPLAAACAGKAGVGAAEDEEDAYPQAPMAVTSAAEGGEYRLVVCATGEGSDERSPWVASLTLVDLGAEPPAIVWEVNLPNERRSDAWAWQPGVPWLATLGKAPPGFEETTPLEEPLIANRLYQISVTGWDPGEILFLIDPGSGAPIHLDAAGGTLPEPRLPCWSGY